MRPSTNRRERILVYGGPGSSKTRSWLTIAEMYRKTKTPGKFYHLDTDDAYWSTVEEFPELAESDIVESRFVYEWEDYVSVTKEFAQKATKDDWIIGDLFDKGWEEAQNYYSEQIYGKGKADYFLLRREEVAKQKTKDKNFQPFDGWTDWSVIKPLHADWANDLIFRNQAHIYLATTQKATDRKTDNKDTTETFAHLGAKPGGEKSIGVHGVQTVLKFTKAGAKEWIMDTAKDRGVREEMIKVENKDFALNYLLNPKRGGWLVK